MRIKAVVIFTIFMGFSFGFLNAQLVELHWNTFLGSSDGDYGYALTRDDSGNLYVTGSSIISWGTPVNAHSGGYDIFVACLNSTGSLLWNTFLGSINNELGRGITLDSTGNIYVAGDSFATWGTPVNAYSGDMDVFVACLDSSGNLVWNTFAGSANDDTGNGIALDGAGNIYITGNSYATWGTPVNAFSGNSDVFVAGLDGSGNLLWHTFLGAADYDVGTCVVSDGLGNIYVVGYSDNTWGTPINAYNGSYDSFVAALDGSGNLLWHTFLGSSAYDTGYAIDLDNSGNIYVTGSASGTWGTPLNAHSGGSDVFVAGLNSSGNLLWNTFLGSSDGDYGRGIVLDSLGNIYLTGECDSSWDSAPGVRASSFDIFVACLDSSGSPVWDTFLGTPTTDYVRGIVLDGAGKVYITGYSDASWGSPINAHSGSEDAYVASFDTHPLSNITANGTDGPISITQSDSLQIRVSLNTFESTANVDYWLAYKGPSGWVHYNNSTKQWEAGLGVTHQGALMYLNNKKVFQSSGLAPGNYTFYFGVDMNMDGKVNKSSLYKDEVQVTMTSD